MVFRHKRRELLQYVLRLPIEWSCRVCNLIDLFYYDSFLFGGAIAFSIAGFIQLVRVFWMEVRSLAWEIEMETRSGFQVFKNRKLILRNWKN
ncbi:MULTISPECIES: hypothetical protein [Spirulina sp. CCY15215]|uniref:hypothetical protein n=1 Tax=Spirulina sp. CCY15215 TaxID=2767591 RepID=UPI0019529D47|nr:hypothetical protein [Spirulina major]